MVVPSLVKEAFAAAVGVVILGAAQGPDETCEPQKTETDRDGNEDGEHVHRRFRSALRETVSDESDMASAARKGVARPASATGTAMIL